MTDEIDLLARWMALPETNKTCFEMMLQDCMSDADQIAVTKALNFIMSSTDGNELR